MTSDLIGRTAELTTLAALSAFLVLMGVARVPAERATMSHLDQGVALTSGFVTA